jgi:hypothetical protein
MSDDLRCDGALVVLLRARLGDVLRTGESGMTGLVFLAGFTSTANSAFAVAVIAAVAAWWDLCDSTCALSLSIRSSR